MLFFKEIMILRTVLVGLNFHYFGVPRTRTQYKVIYNYLLHRPTYTCIIVRGSPSHTLRGISYLTTYLYNMYVNLPDFQTR